MSVLWRLRGPLLEVLVAGRSWHRVLYSIRLEAALTPQVEAYYP